MIRLHPGETEPDYVELAKCRHRTLGFSYDGGQIHRAYDAVAHVDQVSPVHPPPVVRSREPVQVAPWPRATAAAQWTSVQALMAGALARLGAGTGPPR